MGFGAAAQWRFGHGLSLTTEVAWLLVGILSAPNFRWFRADLIKPIAENGAASDQFQLEALLNYQFAPNFSAGVTRDIGKLAPTRRRPTSRGAAGAQAINFRTETWGGFVQASYKFGELSPSNRY